MIFRDRMKWWRNIDPASKSSNKRGFRDSTLQAHTGMVEAWNQFNSTEFHQAQPVHPLMEFPQSGCHTWLNADDVDNAKFLFISWIWFSEIQDIATTSVRYCEQPLQTKTAQSLLPVIFLASALQPITPTPWGGERVGWWKFLWLLRYLKDLEIGSFTNCSHITDRTYLQRRFSKGIPPSVLQVGYILIAHLLFQDPVEIPDVCVKFVSSHKFL